MTLIPLFFRREPAIDPASLALERAVPGSTRRLTSVAFYKDAACTEFLGRFAPDSTTAPRKSTKSMSFNCWRYAVRWAKPLLPSDMASRA